MSTGYSAHPALASEQLQQAENASTTSTQRHTFSPQHRRHVSAVPPISSLPPPPQPPTTTKTASATTTSSGRGISGFFNFTPFKSKSFTESPPELKANTIKNKSSSMESPARAVTSQKTLPDRTSNSNFAVADDYDDVDDVNYDGETEDNTIDHTTKDCVEIAPSALPSASFDETDHIGNRFNRSRIHQQLHNENTAVASIVQQQQQQRNVAFNDGCTSGVSSTISSPSPSTVSSPLSTPTRLTTQLHHHHQNCCRKVSSMGGGVMSSTGSHHQHHHLHHHNHHHNPSSAAASAVPSGCKKLQKFDPRFSPSPYRQLLPILLCILSFATVFTILIIYMDTTEIRHQQFRLNMSRDYDLYGVAQDDPTLIEFLREIHMRKYSMHFLKNRAEDTGLPSPPAAMPTNGGGNIGIGGTLNFSAHHDGLAPEMAHYVADLVGGKTNGAVIQSLTGTLGQLMTAPWLAETLNWAGVIVEPETRRYFTLEKQNAHRSRMQVVHACVSPNPYPKEVTIHNEDSDVRINSLHDEEISRFNPRVKCFPLYTIMLACNRVEYDLLSLGVHGHELEILQTLPFDKIKIEVISIHLLDNFEKTLTGGYIQTITKFLTGKGYKLQQKKFGSNYFYQRINTSNRTRKKDILLLKTP